MATQSTRPVRSLRVLLVSIVMMLASTLLATSVSADQLIPNRSGGGGAGGSASTQVELAGDYWGNHVTV